jgi:putative FmdB family regulatory protein
MPVYEYRCQRCGSKFEQLRRMADADRDLICPDCKSESVERLFSCFAASSTSSASGGGGCSVPSGSRFR